MATRLDRLRNFAADAAERITGNIETTREAIGNLLGPGLTTPETPIEAILGRLGDLLRVDQDEELPLEPPFEGGQCEGVEYLITLSYSGQQLQNFLTCDSFSNTATAIATRNGPISGGIEVQVNENCPEFGTYRFDGVDGDGQTLIIQNPNIWRDPPSVTITRTDGQPDDCGSPPPQYGDDPGSDPVEVGDDGEITGPGFPELPDDWIPEICGLDLEFPCPALEICAGGFRVRVGPCGVEIGFDPRTIGEGDGGAGIGDNPENEEPTIIDDITTGETGEGEVEVDDLVESVFIEAITVIPPQARVTFPSSNPDRVEYWAGFASTGADTDQSGRSYSANYPLGYARNYYPLASGLSNRTVKVRSPAAITWRITDTGERTDRWNRERAEE